MSCGYLEEEQQQELVQRPCGQNTVGVQEGHCGEMEGRVHNVLRDERGQGSDHEVETLAFSLGTCSAEE